MKFRIIPLALAALSLNASVIDSGAILNRFTRGMGDADTWSIRLASSEANYSVFFHMDAAVDISWNCTTPLVCELIPPFPQGYTASFRGFTIGDYGASGSATVNGVNYPNVGFKGTYIPPGSNSSVFYTSGITLQSGQFVLAPGSFAVPFTMTGAIRAATPGASSLLIDDPITGSGTLYFSLRETAGPGSPLAFVLSGFLGDPTLPVPPQMQWVPMPVPEPSTWLLIGGGLFLTALSRLRRNPPGT
jgi:hypothetical protein